jgi:hypothetical protein
MCECISVQADSIKHPSEKQCATMVFSTGDGATWGKTKDPKYNLRYEDCSKGKALVLCEPTVIIFNLSHVLMYLFILADSRLREGKFS